MSTTTPFTATGSKQRVLTFRAGTYDRNTPNERTYSPQDVADLVANFERFSKGPDAIHRPPLVYGHGEDERPAAGTVVDLYAEGPDLFSDWEEIAPEAARWMAEGKLRSVSVELYDDWKQANIPEELAKGSKGPVLRRIALMGSTPPRVKGLGNPPWQTFGCQAVVRSARTGAIAAKPGWKCGDRSMDRAQMLATAGQSGLSQAFLESLSDDQLTALVAELTQKPGDATGSTGGDGTPTVNRPAREDMITALEQSGQDRAALEQMSDDELAALLEQTQAAGTPSAMMGDNAGGECEECETGTSNTTNMGDNGGAGGAAAGAAGAAAAAGVTAGQATATGATATGGGTGNMAQPKQVVLKFSDVLRQAGSYARATVRAEIAKADGDRARAGISAFCDRMVREGKLTPAQVGTEKEPGAVRARLNRANAVRKFGDGKSELELQMAEIEAGPVVRKFGEQIPGIATADTAATGTLSPERRRAILGSTPEGRVLLREKK